MPPGQGPVRKCRRCGKPIRRAWRRPEWCHVENWPQRYCWRDGTLDRDEYAEPESGS